MQARLQKIVCTFIELFHSLHGQICSPCVQTKTHHWPPHGLIRAPRFPCLSCQLNSLSFKTRLVDKFGFLYKNHHIRSITLPRTELSKIGNIYWTCISLRPQVLHTGQLHGKLKKALGLEGGQNLHGSIIHSFFV